jgi:uncharacterized Zn finger protein (UPF0148 family)
VIVPLCDRCRQVRPVIDRQGDLLCPECVRGVLIVAREDERLRKVGRAA